jgi:ubiquinone/menaquinone biosynthesis C-methylase UbiE
MPDVWSTVVEADMAMQERLANLLDDMEADSAAQATLESFLSEIPFPPRSRVLEIGSGPGRVARAVARREEVGEVAGTDPSPLFIEKARERSTASDKLTFEVMDGRKLNFGNDQFDVVIVCRTLIHVPGPEQVLSEAHRVLRREGLLAILDADGATITVASGAFDPLQNCLEAAKAAFLNDSWLPRRLPELLQAAGFDLVSSRYYGNVRTTEPGAILSQVDRGAEVLAAWKQVSPELAVALKEEVRRRLATGRLYAFSGELSFVARKRLG